MMAGSVALSLYVTQTLHRPDSSVGLLFSVCALVEIPAAPATMPFPAGHRRRIIIIAGMALFSGYFVWVAASSTLPLIGTQAVRGIAQRGHHYGTVLIDCESRRVVDLIPGRDASPLTEWLLQHESPDVICRDRASSYAEGARTGAPDAVQVADRFHLWQNLASAVERLVAKHKGCLIEEPTVPGAEPRDLADEPKGAMAQRRQARHALVREMLAQGASFRQIARHLGWKHQDAQTTDVRPSQLRPTPQTSPPGLIPRRTSNIAVVPCERLLMVTR